MRSLLEPTRRAKNPPARQLAKRDLAQVLRVLDADPVACCMVAARLQEFGIDGSGGQGELWSRGGPAESLCFSGVNLVPLLGDQDALRAFAERAVRWPRICSSVVGRQELALPLWEMLAEHWGPARELRADQPLLALDEPPAAVSDPQVRRVRVDELDRYLQAAIAMFIEEVGVDPRAGDGGRGYRRRVAGLIESGRAWARFEDGRVVYKAEVGSLSRRTGQIQGVWVHPDRRGNGLGTAGTAAVANAVIASGRTASLYVNDYNEIARKAYRRVGFRQIATFTTVLLD
ncbi:GNAT family N-acetyltransferase [Nocardia cyriacigeorgica]|uniref:Predicted acetyltransferase n=1 Tax=Nocardia cyriacigeorgica TaxID=135487 RepID=A0A4U8W0Y1_9NOCA|nr:GNAT family N-acetyltransferase [Nocardia cyriacigeorgica]MBF6097186.1 GNAT family N-acetyltransferase [Nocardia cyriacigeorgica]MBF6158661.1 GNAT family N-acetyltransferase [Nocardia cyriacigeorgica]MBF6197652.1 GNAT family N-acetyltransferase [Nocardia cyriacigeorgica]MBF6316517.1 GNAT family N-acetyltransferase [Nocardia cyriacigeorgica]MBF6344947.1 GNAT family N-acetyltransferase [Nocardia cyriacigeorgica]